MSMRLAFLVLFGLAGAALLIGLCVWQVQRLAWKEALIAELGARAAAEPVPLPAAPQEALHAFLSVTLEGRFDAGALHVLSSQRFVGPGFRVVAPFELGNGRRILVDRGFLPEAEKAAPLDAGPVAFTATLLWPNERDMFTPEPNTARNIWFARDPEAMSAVLNTEPVLAVASAATGTPSPAPQSVGVNLRNNHRQYAITWALLAAAWLGMTGLLIYREARGR
ncbi:MAG: SURF1 family protein [Pseudomonadota bacterium]